MNLLPQSLLGYALFASLLLGLLARFDFISYEKLFLINVWMLSVPHTFSTFFRRDLRTAGRMSLAIFVFLGFFVLFHLIQATADFSVLVIAYFFAQQFHYARQNYGISRIQKSDRSPNWLESAFYPGVALISLLGAVSKGPIYFFGFAIRSPFSFVISQPMTLLILVGFLVVFLFSRPKGSWLHALIHFALHVSLLLFSESFTWIWFVMNVFHNFQYLQLMVKTERSLSILFVPYLLSGFFAYFSTLPWMMLVFLSINFTHYLWDARIWRGVRIGSWKVS